MDQLTLNAIHEIQINMIREIHRICLENGIKYVVMSGSLLGAIRHDGFIPWDDDMDIGLIREDYEKLMEILKAHPIEGCFLQEYSTDPHYNQPYAKLLKEGTVFVETFRKECKAKNGIFIDIFPLDYVKNPESSFNEFRRLLSRLITFAVWKKENCHIQRKGSKRLVNFPAALISVLPKRFLISVQRRLVIRNHPEWKFVANMFSCNYKSWQLYFAVEDIKNAQEHPFDSTVVFVPEHWHENLTRLYRNYMQLPPENKRNSGHDVFEIKL